MKILVTTFYILISVFALGQEKDLAYYYNQAKDAYRAKEYPKFYSMIKEANKLHPYHQGILYQLGLASALTGHKTEALQNLKKAILIDANFKLEGLSDFDAIKETPDFKSLLELQRELQTPVIHSDTAFVLKDRTLHTEGIDVDRTTRTFYLGSIHLRKIIKVTAAGVASDYCKEGMEGMTSIFGIKVDPKRNVLWACSSPMQEMKNYDSTTRSAVFKFELSTGKLLDKFQRPAFDRDGVFGDLIVNKNGEVFISDSQTNTIYIVREKTHQLEPFFNSPDFMNIQGLALSGDEKFLFISDYIKGLYRLEMKTKALSELKCNLDVSLKGIDGLMVAGQDLVTIQNGTSPFRVMRFGLNATRDQIVKYDVIDRKHPAFNEPTLGVVDGNTLYYIANSQWGGYTAQHELKPNDQLQDIVVLKGEIK